MDLLAAGKRAQFLLPVQALARRSCVWVCFSQQRGIRRDGGGSRKGTGEGAGNGRGQRRDEMSPFQGRRKMKANGLLGSGRMLRSSKRAPCLRQFG